MRALLFERSGAIALLSLGLMGFCEGVTTDPAQGGLVGGLCGLSTGAYRKRIVARSDEIDGLAQVGRRLRQRVVTNQRAAVDLGARVKRLRSHVAALSRDLAEQSVAERQQRLELVDVERQIDGLRSQLAALVDEERRRAKAEEAIATGRRRAQEARAVAKARQDNMALQALDAEIDQLERRARERAAQ